MNRFKETIFRHPFIFSLIILTISSIATEIRLEPYLKGFMNEQNAMYATITLEQGLWSILLVCLICSLGCMKNAGFTKPKEWKQIWAAWPILVLIGLNGLPFFDGTLRIDTSKPDTIILFILLNLSVGFFEEILGRGTILMLMVRKWGSTKSGIYRSVILSSLLFGLMHIINFMAGRSTLMTVAVQMSYSVFFGAFFAACVLRNRSIWLAIITHAVFDLFGGLQEIAVNGTFGQIHQTTMADALSTLIVTLPIFFYSLFLIRKVPTAAAALRSVD